MRCYCGISFNRNYSRFDTGLNDIRMEGAFMHLLTLRFKLLQQNTSPSNCPDDIDEIRTRFYRLYSMPCIYYAYLT